MSCLKHDDESAVGLSTIFSGNPHLTWRLVYPIHPCRKNIAWRVASEQYIKVKLELTLPHPYLHPSDIVRFTSISIRQLSTMKFATLVSVAVLFFANSLTSTYAAPMVIAAKVRSSAFYLPCFNPTINDDNLCGNSHRRSVPPMSTIPTSTPAPPTSTIPISTLAARTLTTPTYTRAPPM